jgi:Ca2+-binding RTX toxin-like protein
MAVAIDFGNFAGVNMLKPGALGKAIFSNYPTFNFLTGFADETLLEIPNRQNAAAATAFIEAFGQFSYDDVTDKPTADSRVHDFQVNVPGGGYRVVMVGMDVSFATFESALLNRNLTSLYAGQALEIHGTLTNNDTLVGGALGDDILGYGGQDVLIGNAGNDTLDGMGGRDTMRGGLGNDDYGVLDATDLVVENADEGLDLVYAAVDGYRLPANVEGLALLDFAGAIDGTGNSLDNFMSGNPSANRMLSGTGNDTLTGLGGNDVLDGGEGSDQLVGGTGADILRGGNGNDLLYWDGADISVNGEGGIDTLRLSSGSLNLLNVDNGKIVDIERISLVGGGANGLTLAVSDVLAISSTTDTLRILGESADTVNLPNSFDASGAVDGYTRYRSGAATLWIDSDIAVV